MNMNNLQLEWEKVNDIVFWSIFGIVGLLEVVFLLSLGCFIAVLWLGTLGSWMGFFKILQVNIARRCFCVCMSFFLLCVEWLRLLPAF